MFHRLRFVQTVRLVQGFLGVQTRGSGIFKIDLFTGQDNLIFATANPRKVAFSGRGFFSARLGRFL
jgi:hypothetical protein